jgi:hypothetical protein
MTDARRKVILVIVMILLLGFVYFDQNKSSVGKGSSSVSGLEMDLKRASDHLKRQLTKQSEFDELIENKSNIEQSLWAYQEGDSPRSLIHQNLRELIGTSNLVNLTVAVGREKQIKSLDSIRAIDFSINGVLSTSDQENFYQFMRTLESDAKLYHWSSLSLSQHGGQLRVSAVLRAYVYISDNELDKESL